MNHKLFSYIPVLALTLASCAASHRMVYSAGFTFSKYDFLVVAKPDSGQNTSMFGLDIEIANMMARYNMKIVGDKEYAGLTPDEKQHTLFARFSAISNNKKDNLITISFDDAISGKTVASLTSRAKGDMFDVKDRTKAIDNLSAPLIEALSNEKGLKVTSPKGKP